MSGELIHHIDLFIRINQLTIIFSFSGDILLSQAPVIFELNLKTTDMISQLTHLNWIGILLAFVAYSILGALWFTVFFAKSYRISLGRENEILPNQPIFIVGPMLCTLVITITTAVLMYALNVTTISAAVEFALLTSLGLLVANTVNIAINPNIPRPILYGIISGVYHILGMLIASCILVLMK
jgi:hypothetical protein